MKGRDLAVLSALIVASWPLLVAITLVGLLYELAWDEPGLLAAMSGVAVGSVAWVAGARAQVVQRWPGLWLLYCGIGIVPLSMFWIALADFSQHAEVGRALRAAFLVQPFSGPLVLSLGLAVAIDLATSVSLTKRFARSAMSMPTAIAVTSGAHWAAAIGVALMLRHAGLFPL